MTHHPFETLLPEEPKVAALLVLPDNRLRLVEVFPWPAMAQIRQLVGGDADVRYCIRERWHLYHAAFGEEQGFELNRIASRLLQEAEGRRIRLYGSVVIIGTAGNGTDIDVPKTLVKWLSAELKDSR